MNALLQCPRRLLAPVLAGLAAGLAAGPLVAAAPAQEGPARPDHVWYRSEGGELASLSGRVVEDTLDGLRIALGSEVRALDALAVERIQFGHTPPAFQDGLAQAERGDQANAAASFRLCAADELAPAPLRAEARLRAARAELWLGARDPQAWVRAREQAQRLVQDFPNARGVPEARWLAARAARLAGAVLEAAQDLRSLARELALGTAGYPAALCLWAGLDAAEAFLAAGAVEEARATYRVLETLLPRALATRAADERTLEALAAVRAALQLGEGWCQLAAGSLDVAKAFFEGQLGLASEPAVRFGARLGLAQTLFAQGATRAAQLSFAEVSALDAGDRGRVALALVGLARCTLALGDQNARRHAQRWVQTVQERYADTPAAAQAQELAQRL